MNQDDISLLLERGNEKFRPSLENRVAYQFELESRDLIGYRNAVKRNQLVLDWSADHLSSKQGSRKVIDLGCAHGNYMFMLNGRMGKSQDIEMFGIDIGPGLQYANAFAQNVEGYTNCKFMNHDLESRLPFEDGFADIVILADVLEHLERPKEVLAEIRRVLKPDGIAIISTPLKDSLFKRVAAGVNKLSGGKLYKSYYAGKDTELDEHGNPVMEVHAGHEHISEMTFPELRRCLTESGFAITGRQLMQVMSGSNWFGKHEVLLWMLLLLEIIHDCLQIPSWAHGVCLKASPTKS